MPLGLEVFQHFLRRHRRPLGRLENPPGRAEIHVAHLAFHDDRVTAHGHDGRNLGLFQHLFNGHAGAGPGGADDGDHFVHVDELFGDGHRFGRVAFSVAHDQLEFLAVDSAIGVNLVHHHFRHQLGRRADGRSRAGHVEKSP